MSPPRNARSASYGKRTKPPALKKTTILPSHPAAKTSPSSSKTIGKSAPSIDPDDEEMACLPHFCAMCEKQLITPGSSILYCSENCRRKDGNKPLSRASITLDQSPLPTSPRWPSSSDLQSYPDIIPQRSPTMVRPASITFSDTSETSIFDQRPSYSRTESEAARYLAQFRSSDASPERRRRPQYERQTSTSHDTIPSLSHTPGSMGSPMSSYSSSRPLPSRTNPYGASLSAKSVDLVTPLAGIPTHTAPASLNHANASMRSSASTSTAFRIVDGGLSYEKKPYTSESSPGQGSLKQLFSPASASPLS